MTSKWNVLFDLDDTLIHCNKYFDLIIEQFADLMEEWFSPFALSKEEIKRKQQEIDLSGIDVHGFAMERFPESFAETYDYYSAKFGRPVNMEERRELLDIGFSVYDSEFELYPDVVETLSRLKDDGHTLSLYTGGVEEIQRKKIVKVNLTAFFEDRIHVALHKNTDALAGVLKKTGYDPAVTWMVGNSLRTDIIPAIENGIGAVYIPPLSNWAFDMVDIQVNKSDRMLKVKSIKKVPQAIAKFYFKK